MAAGDVPAPLNSREFSGGWTVVQEDKNKPSGWRPWHNLSISNLKSISYENRGPQGHPGHPGGPGGSKSGRRSSVCALTTAPTLFFTSGGPISGPRVSEVANSGSGPRFRRKVAKSGEMATFGVKIWGPQKGTPKRSHFTIFAELFKLFADDIWVQKWAKSGHFWVGTRKVPNLATFRQDRGPEQIWPNLGSKK